jgi:3',5'-cyclic AMP phosphodiesterase CpdA
MSGLDALIHRQDATAWDRFMSSPLIFLARWLHLSPPISLVCISDTHNTHHAQPHLPEGDILIHAGDLTQSGTDDELDDALAWLNSHPHPTNSSSPATTTSRSLLLRRVRIYRQV